jgi:CRISPR-associated protein Cas1
MASKRLFEVFHHVLPESRRLPGRRKRPRTDPVNPCTRWATPCCSAASLRPTCLGARRRAGFFHESRPGRASLACDLMEPLRVAGGINSWTAKLSNW